jgi:hypothetical protein
MEVRFEQVKPPQKARVDQIGETLGLCAGLRARRSDGQFRCGECLRMQAAGSWKVWVPDGVRKGDPSWSVEEAARLITFNGSATAWCLECAPKAKAGKRPWWKFWG